MYAVVISSRYRRALKRISRHKDFNEEKPVEVVEIIAKGEYLPQKYRDHELSGSLAGIRECHVQNDLLLLYKIKEDKLVLVLVDLSTHSDLF